MAEFTEKRRFTRYTCETGVLIRLIDSSGGFWGHLSDISLGGCYVYTFSPLAVGQGVALAIKANDMEIDVTGKTVSSHPGVGMGVAFTGFSRNEGEQNLTAFLNHLDSLPKDKQAGVFY